MTNQPGGFAPALHVPRSVAADIEQHGPYRSPSGSLCYSLDGWSVDQFESQVQTGGVLSEVVEKDPPRTQLLHREVFGRLFGMGVAPIPEEAIDPAVREWAPELHKQASELPEWREMAAAADGDPMLCGIATANVGRVLSAMMPGEPPKPEREAEEHRDLVRELLKEAKGNARADLQALESKLDRALGYQLAQRRQFVEKLAANGPVLRSKLRTACEAATKEIMEARAAGDMASRLAGEAPGTGQGRASSRARSEALKDQRLRQVMALAGRMRHEVAAKRRVAGAGREEIHSVKLGSEIDRLLPVEVAMLGAPMGPELLVGKLADQRALQYALRGSQKKTKGPVIIAIDESGSMSGERDRWAKAVALSLMWIAQQEKRPFCVIHFSTHVRRYDAFGEAKAPIEKLREVVAHFESGGTDINNALSAALALVRNGVFQGPDGSEVKWTAAQKSDVILISDGADSSGTDAAKQLAELGVGLYGIAIESSFDPKLAMMMEAMVQIRQPDIEKGAVPDVLLKV